MASSQAAGGSAAVDDGDAEGDVADMEIEIDVKKWVDEQMEAEVARLKEVGQPVIRLPVRNCSVVRQVKDVVNRVEVDSAFGFEAVQQLMLSGPTPLPDRLPGKSGYAMRFVVLSTGKPLLLILPYVYDATMVGNTLKDWDFINSKLQSTRHRVEADLT
mmetsp:Transcript_4598/g.7614  ORF Transcript_4598/g.7614 Transcript_4598/m.7614 type:complete len:159 (-) Transcript_4598:298-774(-)